MERQYLYDAFISYRHNPADKALAIKLQTLLEQHKGSDGKPLRMFRDQSELPTSGDLGQDITEALEQSRFLIVVCSPSYQESKWCMRELTYFRELHGNTNQNILPILTKGEPREVMPDFPRESLGKSCPTFCSGTKRWARMGKSEEQRLSPCAQTCGGRACPGSLNCLKRSICALPPPFWTADLMTCTSGHSGADATGSCPA